MSLEKITREVNVGGLKVENNFAEISSGKTGERARAERDSCGEETSIFVPIIRLQSNGANSTQR
jgi:hypothetical protein